MKILKLMIITLMMSLCFNSFSQSDTIYKLMYQFKGNTVEKLIVDEITMVTSEHIYFTSVDGKSGFIKKEFCTYYSRNNVVETKQRTAGNELIIASNRFNLGISLVGIGSVVSVVSSVASNSFNNSSKGVLILGSAISLAGVVIIIESHRHIKKAGLILNGNGIGVKIKI